MVDKFGEACLGPLEVGKRHYRRGRRDTAIKKHRKPVDEVANGGLAGFLPIVDLRGKEVRWHLQLVAEIAHLFRLCLKVFVFRMGEDKVEHPDAPLNVLDFVFPAVTKILPADLAVQPAREHVIDVPVHWEVFGARMLLSVKLVPKGGRALAPMATGESEELTRYEITRMRGHDVEKASFGFRVTQRLQGFKV